MRNNTELEALLSRLENGAENQTSTPSGSPDYDFGYDAGMLRVVNEVRALLEREAE